MTNKIENKLPNQKERHSIFGSVEPYESLFRTN